MESDFKFQHIPSMQNAGNHIGDLLSGGFLFVITVKVLFKAFSHGRIKVKLKLFLNAQFPDLVIGDNL